MLLKNNFYCLSLVLDNAFQNREMLLDHLSRHYLLQLLQEVHNILGSVDFLGSPVCPHVTFMIFFVCAKNNAYPQVSLIHNLASGVLDFFVEPSLAST